MTIIKRTTLIAALSFFGLLVSARAQRPAVSTVNVTPEANKVRVAPVGEVSDLRIEVTDESGETIFEAAQGAQEQIDWQMKDSAGVRVSPGTYTVTVSYITQAGKARKRIEQVLVTDEVKGGSGTEQAGGERTPSAPADSPTPLLDGSGAANKIPKFVDADTFTSSAIMDVSGRIGIGTVAAPAAGLRLEINGNTRMTPSGGNGGYMQFGTPNGETGLSWIKGTTSRADIRFNGSRLMLATGSGVNVPANTGVVINTAGRVGIGTAAPTNKLHVNGGSEIAVYGESSHTGVKGYGQIGVYGESRVAGGRGVLAFGYANGSLGIDAVTNGANSTAVSALATGGGHAGDFTGKVKITGPLTVTGNVCAANIPCSSDARLKHNITGLGYGLNHLLRLRPVSWRWKSEPEGKPQMGLVAQEVERVLPELVLREADETKPLGLNYMALLPVAVKAIQEQQELIKQLQARVAQLERVVKKKRAGRPSDRR